MTGCPKCGETLGIIESKLVTEGALLQHKFCGAVLIVTDARPGPELHVRLATEAEKAARPA